MHAWWPFSCDLSNYCYPCMASALNSHICSSQSLNSCCSLTLIDFSNLIFHFGLNLLSLDVLVSDLLFSLVNLILFLKLLQISSFIYDNFALGSLTVDLLLRLMMYWRMVMLPSPWVNGCAHSSFGPLMQQAYSLHILRICNLIFSFLIN